MANVAAAAPGPAPVAQAKRKAKRKRNLLQWVTESGAFKFFILACIIVNALMLGYDANFGPDNAYRDLIGQWNQIFLWIFTAELVLEFLAQGPRRYVRSGWNWFDVVIVAASWGAAVPGVTALRAFRVIRVFRLVSNVPQMQRVVEALMK
ncbi:MAG: ion transporter, partial [Hyphomonadaceae bacterium]|nr:ion transporter [Hyphomonadaceae bacterium]